MAIGSIEGLRRVVRARLVREAVAGAVGALPMAFVAAQAHESDVRAAAAGVVVCTVSVVGFLAARGGVRPDAELGVALRAQAALLRSAWAWYGLPLGLGIGGFAAVVLTHVPEAPAGAGAALALGVAALVALVGWVNRRAAVALEAEAARA